MKYKHLIFFLLLSFFVTFPIKAMTPNVEYIDDIYSNRLGGEKPISGQLGYIVADGKVIFCLEPYAVIGKSYEVNNDYFNNIPSDKLRYIQMVANYVDPYVQDRNVHYYMAAQELIWEQIIGENKVFWTTQKDGNGSRINIDIMKKDIKNHVDNFLTKPSFNGTVVKDNFFTTIELTDTNNVLQNYEIINDSKNIVWKGGNKLYINILSSKLSSIKLVRKYGSGSPIYYHNAVNQDIASLTSYIENTATINIQANNIYNEDITVQFIDRQTNALVTDNIDFKIVGNNTTNKFSTANGMYTTNLNQGKYDIVVENVPYGYLLPDVLNIELSEDNPQRQRTFLIYLDKPTGKLSVKIEKDGLYQLYKDEDIDLLISTFESSSIFDIPLGKYYIIDLLNNKKHYFEIKYKDQFTPIIYYDIYYDFIDNKINPRSSLDDNNTIYNEYEMINKQNKLYSSYSLPNTIDYIKVLKTILIILLIMLLFLNVKDHKK